MCVKVIGGCLAVLPRGWDQDSHLSDTAFAGRRQFLSLGPSFALGLCERRDRRALASLATPRLRHHHVLDPLCQPEAVELVHADPADAEALRDLHLLTWEVTYRPHAAEAWYSERLVAHSVRDW